ncbi:meiotic nuclear division protein 1 [Pyronema omphalodes]|nr:meiotic nuclear division protein 1 [Pyronema omphalodes]
MAPSKSLPPAKLALVINYIRTQSVAYTLKDLEKLLPPAAGISSMLVKDYLGQLVADNLLTVEKIGSGNWYWSFPVDAKRQKENVLNSVTQERDKARALLDVCEKQVNEEKERLASGDDGEDRVGLIDRVSELQRKKNELSTKIEAFSNCKGAEIVVSEAEKLRLKHNTIVDNLYALESYYKELVQNDPEKMAQMREHFGFEEEIDYIEKSG